MTQARSPVRPFGRISAVLALACLIGVGGCWKPSSASLKVAAQGWRQAALKKAWRDKKLALSACAFAQEQVRARLKTPATAKFSSCYFSKDNAVSWDPTREFFKIEGPVDAQNSFGAKLRSSFVATVRRIVMSEAETRWTTVDISIGHVP